MGEFTVESIEEMKDAINRNAISLTVKGKLAKNTMEAQKMLKQLDDASHELFKSEHVPDVKLLSMIPIAMISVIEGLSLKTGINKGWIQILLESPYAVLNNYYDGEYEYDNGEIKKAEFTKK